MLRVSFSNGDDGVNDYHYRIGAYDASKGSVAGFWMRLSLLLTGCTIGLVAAVCVLYYHMQHEPVRLEVSQGQQ